LAWYAIRTSPGAQQPKREYWTDEAPRSPKGYRLASGVASDYSAVELALKDAGFTYYMPVEFVAVRNRQRPNLYELRRFAMLKGYMFVGDLQPGDWARLLGSNGKPGVPGVNGVVGDGYGVAYPISTMDIFRLRMIEQSSRAEAQAKVDSLSKAADRVHREQRKLASRNARKKLFPGREVKLIWGDKVGREATVQAWQDQETVKVLLQGLEAATETITVPYEFLKIAG
jgi:hypothetical protein